MPWTIELAIGLWMIGQTALARGYRPLHGTTLRAVWWWSFIALGTVVATELAIGIMQPQDNSWAEPLRFIAAASTFCPLVALLGAKRPQDRAWQWIVLSFWVILALPAAQAWLLRPGELSNT